jgi:predicted dehydrogenase
MCAEFAMPQAACFQSLASALQEISCDAVIVATPMWRHHETVTLSLEAGRHVLCEKPLATSLAEAVSLDQAATRTGHILMVGQSYRYRRPARAVRRVLTDATLGRLLCIRMITRRDTSSFWNPNDTRYTIPHFYLLDNGVHHLDTLRAVTRRDVTRVFSRGWPTPGSPYTHEAGGVTLLDLEDGASVLYDNEYATCGGRRVGAESGISLAPRAGYSGAVATLMRTRQRSPLN